MTRLELARKHAEELKGKSVKTETSSNSDARLELARKHAEELKGKSVKTETSSNSDARLELARKHANELKEAQEERNKQAQLAQEYIAEHGTDEINQKYNEYMQSVNEIIAPKLYQTKGMQELVSKRMVTTPQEVTKLSTANADKIDKYGDSVFNTAVKEDWANKGNLAQRRIANKMGLKSDNSYIEELAKRTYNTVGSIGYGIGRTVSKLGMKAALNLADQFANLGSDFNKQIERQQALIKEGVPMLEAIKIAEEETKAERAKRREEIQNKVNQLDSKTIQEYGNKTFLVSASNFASNMAMAILGANGMTSAGINPIVSNALAQGAKGYAESASSTTNRNDIAVNTISSAAWGAIFNGANNLLGKTGLGKVSTNKLANFGRIFAKNALSSAIASGTTQTLDMFKSNPNYDYIDWQEVEKGIQSGKYKNIEEFLDSNDYISMVTKNRASQITISAIITAFINTSVEYGKNPSIQQIQKQDDAYKTLGLSKNASDEEIRSAYRKLAKLYHPDNSTTGNTEMFTKISEAYHTIIDSRIISQSIQTTQPSSASQNTNSSLMNLPQGDISYLYQKYNIPRINTNAQLQQNAQNTSNNVQNISNNEKLPQNASNNVSELPQNTTNTIQGKVTTPTNKSQNLIPNNSNIRGLEDYTEQDIKNIVSDYIQDLDTGVKIKDIALNGSRARGNSKATSDLDVVVEYDGDMTEDSLFNELNKEPLIIDGIKVDINPITASKSGTLEEYMKRSKSYDEQQNLITNTQTSKAKEVVEELAKEYDGYILVSKISDKATEIVQDELGSKAKLTDNMVLDRKKEIEKQIEIELVNQGYEINKDWEGDSYYAPKSEEKADPLTETNTKTSASENLTANDSVQSKSTNKNVTARSKTKAEKIEDFGEKIGGARKDLWVGTIGHAKKEVIPNYSIARDITTNEDGTEITDYSVKFKGETLKSGLKTEKEAEEFINSFKSSLKANRATVKKSEYFQNEDGTDAYEIVVTDPKTLKKSSTGKIFYDKAEAESYAMALSMYLSENGKNIGRPAIQVITRINPEFANTKKATGQDILDDFKFRAGEFGNWVSNAERQKFLNYCYDALTDLAIALDVPLDNISYRGKMAIAFGARGRGLVGAAAHFEPDAKVINMTRLKGAGSLAHEMGHALDNYLSQISGYDENELLSTHSSYGKLPEKVKEAYRGLLDAIQYNTSTNQEEIDKKNRIYEKNRKESLEYYLKYYDEVFKGEASTYKKVKGKYEKVPIKVTDEQKQEYQRIRNILFDGKLENKLEFNSGEPGKSWTYAEPLETLRKLIKEVTNKKANNDTLYSIYTYGKQSKEVKEVKSQSAFSKAALELDRVLGRATAYASTIQEKIARSFEAFIYDELEKKGITDTYLVHSVHNRDYALFNPFPAGEERTKINTAWRNLINAMKDEALFDESSTIVFEPKEEYKTTTLKDEIERYKDLPKEEMSFYDLQYNGYYEDTSLAIENYIKETYDLKGKDLNVYVEDSRVSESKYIRIEDENDEVAEIRLSTHSNNETHPDYQKQVFYNKNDSIDEVERMIDEAVREVLKSTFKYNIDIIKESDYNVVNEPNEPYNDYKNHIFIDEDGIDIGNIKNDLISAINSRYDGNPPKNVTLCIPWRNDCYLYRIDDNLKLNVICVVRIEGNEALVNFFEKEFGDDAGKYAKRETERYDSPSKRNRGRQRFGISSDTNIEKRTSSATDERIFNKEQKNSNIANIRQSNKNSTNLENSKQSSFSLSKNNLKLKEPSEEYNADLSAEEKLEAYVDRIKEGFGELDKIIGMGYNYLDTNYGIGNYKDKSVPSRNLLFDLEDNIRMQKHFAKENNIDISNMTDKERREYFDYRKNKKFETFVKKYVDNIYDVEKPIITPEELMEIAQDIHGTTDDYSVGAYMTIDGQLLDFDYGGFRDDHRSLSVPGYNMDSFMKAGNIRMQPEGSGFEVAVEPTEAQYERLADYIDNYIDDDINVDIDGTNDGRTYPRGTDSEKIIDDIRYYFRNGEFPQKSQYADFLNEPRKTSTETPIKVLKSTETPIKVLKSTEKISKPQVVGQRIWEGFKKQGYIDLNGKTVRNSQDVAELSQIFRNPKYETFRVIYTNGNTIVGQEAVTSYLPNSARVTTDENMPKAYYKIKDRMSRLSANGYYLVHNHPAGTAKASMSDIRTTEKIERNIKGFKGHVIVDHGTYAYIFKDDLGMNWQDELKVDDKNALYKGSQFETKLLSNKIPWNEIQIKSRSDFASLMHNLKNSTDYSTLILCDSKEKINAIIDVPNSFFNMRQSHVEGYIKNISKKYGAVDAFIGTSDENTFNKIQQFSNLRDSVLYKDNTKEFGSKKGNSVFNDEKSFAMRTTEETEEERRERVQKYIEEMQETIGTLGAKVDRKAIVDRIINDYGIVQKGNSKELNRVSKEIQDLIERGALTDSKIENYAEELIDNLRITVNDYYNANKELKELIRRTKLYASDTVKNGFGQWEEFRKQNIGTLRLTNDTEALPVDTFYKELTETYGESIFPSDIANTSDQLEKISEVAKSIKKIDQTLRENIEENFGEEAREEIVKGFVENLKTLREKAKQSSSTNEEVPPDTEIKKRSWTKTVRKNDMVSTFLDIKDMKYVVKGNKGTVARANDILESEGYEDSLKYFESIVESGKFPTANEIALGERLIQESIKLGKFEKATELVSDVSTLGTELGQSVQAMSIIHRLSPAGQLMHLKRAVDRINKKQMEKGSSTTSKLPKEIRKNSKLKEMVDKIVTGEQSKLKLKEEMQGKFDVNDIIDKIEKGEQEKIELPKEIKGNSDLMELITKIEKGEQTKIELQKETQNNTELGKIVTKVIDGEQTKIDLGITDEAISEKKKFKKGKIELTPEMELAILCSQTPEELEMAVTRVKEQLAIQMPVSFGDKLQAWRYLAMLGNPVTHIKNVLGNTTMKIPYSLKNVTQRALETIFDDKLEERTRTFERATKDVKNFAEQMLMDNKDTLTGNGYSNIQSELMSMRRIFKTKWLEWTRKKVSNALSIEDFWAKKGVFKKALAEYLTANGIKTNQDIKNNQELVQKGINFATEEALKATFNQYSKVASALNKFENTNELTKIAIGGTIPFKKTPMNITKTSVQYNSLGLAETLLIETKRLKKGKITENEYIERISQGLTGTEIMILGIWLASLGLISASGGSKEDKYKESIGMFRPYSINIGKIHIDITWLSPAAVPLLMGAEIYESAKGKDKTWWERILDGGEVLSKVLNPIAETTMLSSLNDVLSNYGGELSYDALGEVIKSIISSYIGQVFPTLGGRINRLIDPTIRSTEVSKNSKASFLEGIIRTNINKIPGLSYLLEPSIDIWGNVKRRSDSAVLRGANAFINPANLTIDESTKVDEEILRVYHVNENEKVLPKTRVNKYFTSKSVKYEMSAKEYTQFKIDYGQTAYSKLEELFSTKEYLQMSDTEKENAIDKVYDLANDIAKYRYMTDKYGEEGLKKILDDNAYKKYTKAKEVASITYEQYLEVYYAQSGIKSDKNKNGETIKGSETKKKVEAIQKALPKLTKEQATKLKKIFAGDLL